MHTNENPNKFTSIIKTPNSLANPIIRLRNFLALPETYLKLSKKF